MKLLQFKDYVFSPNADMIMDKGVFIGTKNYFYFLPSKTESYSFNKITTSEFSFKGKNIDEAIVDIISKAESLDDLEMPKWSALPFKKYASPSYSLVNPLILKNNE